MNKTFPTPIQGFTLIEMTVVLLLITLLASVAIRETNSLSFQVRYEQTQERLERIREAILGNPRQIINGQQAISGFVADMGRLPNNLHELLEREFCSDREYSTQATCAAAGKIWNPQPDWTFHSASGLWYGWRGPYLNISGSALDDDASVDGWGRMAQDFCTNIIYTDETACTTNGATWTLLANDNNYGWWFIDLFNLTNNASDSGNLIVQSFGKNHQKDNSIPTTVDYENDYPPNSNSNGTVFYPNPIVRQQDWQIDISGGITINLLKPYQSLGGFCGFLASQTSSFTTLADCKNAGGSCTDTSPNDGNCDSICAINSSTCKDLGGKWQSCFFTSAQCSDVGGTWQESCEFTPLSCAASSGTWNTTTQVCDFTSATCPATATWDGSKCVFKENSCFNNHGTWQKQCKFSNQADCELPVANGGPGGTWNNDNPASCAFSASQCSMAGGISNGRDCYATHQEGNSSASPYTQYSCQIESEGSWFYYTFSNASNFFNQRSVCMVIWYRSQTASIAYLRSSSATIEENGSYQELRFSNFKDQDGNDATHIPIGKNAIGIYEYDGDCDPVNNPLYPADRQNPIQVDFHPRTGLPVINW
jgi:prepilin-type N-terminal cleavage/methylation domain-containing protein